MRIQIGRRNGRIEPEERKVLLAGQSIARWALRRTSIHAIFRFHNTFCRDLHRSLPHRRSRRVRRRAASSRCGASTPGYRCGTSRCRHRTRIRRWCGRPGAMLNGGAPTELHAWRHPIHVCRGERLKVIFVVVVRSDGEASRSRVIQEEGGLPPPSCSSSR